MVSDILKAVGGKENVSKASHCATRLRLVLKDESLFRWSISNHYWYECTRCPQRIPDSYGNT